MVSIKRFHCILFVHSLIIFFFPHKDLSVQESVVSRLEERNKLLGEERDKIERDMVTVQADLDKQTKQVSELENLNNKLQSNEICFMCKT